MSDMRRSLNLEDVRPRETGQSSKDNHRRTPLVRTDGRTPLGRTDGSLESSGSQGAVAAAVLEVGEGTGSWFRGRVSVSQEEGSLGVDDVNVLQDGEDGKRGSVYLTTAETTKTCFENFRTWMISKVSPWWDPPPRPRDSPWATHQPLSISRPPTHHAVPSTPNPWPHGRVSKLSWEEKQI